MSMVIAALLLGGMPLQTNRLDPFEGGCAIAQGPMIQVHVEGLKDRTGRLKVELYPANEEDFLRDDTELLELRKPFRRVWAQIPASNPATICIRAPYAGKWAMLVTHDRDGRNKFNFWKDGAGFPKNNRLGRVRPKLNQALIDVPAQGGQLTVKLQYLRGLGGFGPLTD